jgi:hypothetical protein
MSNNRGKIRFGLWYDFRNPVQWRQPADRLYREILDQIAWGENNGFDDVWLSEHHFVEDGYLPSVLPAAAAIAARTNRIRIASGVLLMPFHNPIVLLLDLAARAAATLGADAPGAVRLEGDPSVSLTANARLRIAAFGASSSLPCAPAKVRSQTELPTLALARPPFLGQGLRVIAASR